MNVDITCGASCIISGIPNELSQVILNIINNSKDAFITNKTASPNISIHVEYDSPDAVIRILDNAGGIAPEIAGRVFEPYFTTKKSEMGTGIGLYMSKMIIMDHFKGSINFHNAGEGVEFVIRIPGKLNK